MQIIKHLHDDQYPQSAKYNVRISARGVCINSLGKVALTHLLADDKFGHRDYYELPGGGKKLEETVLQAATREMKEELGIEVKLLEKLGIVHDFYNLISQENFSYYYLFEVVSEGTAHLELRESGLIDKIEWILLNKAIELFKKQLQQTGVGLLVAKRELQILKLASKFFDKGKISK